MSDTLGPNDDTEAPTVGTVTCAACGSTVEATAPDDGSQPVCSQCGELLDTSDGADANAATIQDASESGITSPDADQQYSGDDVRSMREHAAREIVREVIFRSVEGGDGLTLEGYAAVFNDPADIVDQHGSYRETIQRGAFTRTISHRKPTLLFDHGNHPLIGTMPIGQINLIREDAKGLFIRARLSDNWLMQPVRDAVRDGAIHGMSIRADVVADDWSPNLTDRVVERSVKELALKELGPVVFPAYENTSVSVRSRDIATALIDPDTRAEVARAALNGTGTTPPAGSTDDPTHNGHSFDLIRRQALKVLAIS